MKNQTTTIDPRTLTETEYAEHLDNIGHAAAHISIRAKHAASGLQYLADLNRAQYADRKRDRITDMVDLMNDYEREHDTHAARAEAHQAEADRLNKFANDIKNPADKRAEAAADAQEEARAAARERVFAAAALGHADDIAAVIGKTSSSDRADIAHSAIVAYLEFMQDCDWIDEEGEAFYAAISAAGREVTAVAAAAGHPNNRTYKRSITAAAAAEWLSVHPNEGTMNNTSRPCRVPFSVRGGTSAGYWTVEHKEATKRAAAGWYKIAHYKTYAPTPINEEVLNIPTHGGIFDPDDTEAFINHCKPSPQQRAVLFLLAADIAAYRKADTDTRRKIATVWHVGTLAVDAHQKRTEQRIAAADTPSKRKRIEREAAKQTDRIRAAAMLHAAFAVEGVTNKDSRTRAINRLRDKMKAAKDYRPEALPEIPTTIAPQITPTITATTTDRDQKPTEYAEYRVKFVQTVNAADLVTVPKQDEPTEDKTPNDPVKLAALRADLNARIAATLDQYRRELPTEERRAATLARKAEDAQKAAEAARAAANEYSTKDTTTAARAARRAATAAEEAAQDYRRRAADMEQDVQRMRDYVDRYTNSRHDF